MKTKDKPKSEVRLLKLTIRELKASLKAKDRKIRQLKSELRQLEKAFGDSLVYIDDKLSDVPVEMLVSKLNKEKNEKDSKASTATNWDCFKCDDGVLRIIIVNRMDGKHYFRACNKCENRTRLKVYHDEVQD